MGKSLSRGICLAAAPVLVSAGAGAWAMITQQLKAQQMEVHPDSAFLAGRTVAGPLGALAQASVIDKHALAMSEGRTFAEVSEESHAAQERGDTELVEQLAGTREMLLQANLLRSSLFTSVLAYGVAALTAGIGVLSAAVAAGLTDQDD